MISGTRWPISGDWFRELTGCEPPEPFSMQPRTPVFASGRAGAGRVRDWFRCGFGMLYEALWGTLIELHASKQG